MSAAPLFPGFAERWVEVDGQSIHCLTAGEGPPVLLLHGFPQSLAMWSRVAPRLAERFSVVCADLRGYGDSAKPPCAVDAANYSFRAMAHDQVGLMEQLGFECFHAIGHDRGGRTVHRMALDHPGRIASMTVLDIVPTLSMFGKVDRHVARAYWHWYFLQQPAPYPERVIGADPDTFYDGCLFGWGATRLEDFDPVLLAEYRRCWRDPAMIHGSCSDYRAAATVDFALDEADAGRRVTCPSLAVWGADGLMHRLFDLKAEWAARCENLETATLPGGHFFVDQHPQATADVLMGFLDRVR
jgi:haloacetate dehalogenase